MSNFRVSDTRVPIGSVSRREVWNADKLASTELGDLSDVTVGSVLQFTEEKWNSEPGLESLTLDPKERSEVEPAVVGKVYYDSNDGNLYLFTGAGWKMVVLKGGEAIIVDVDTSGNVGQYSSLAVINGNPAITYQDVTSNILKYVRATDVIGSAWGLPVTVDNGDFSGRYTSLAEINGFPAVIYTEADNDRVRYATTEPTGLSWTIVNIGTIGDQGTSLAEVDGLPAATWYDQEGAQQALAYRRRSASGGTVWGATKALDVNGGTRYPSLAIIAGIPSVSYYDRDSTLVKFIRAVDPTGEDTPWESPQDVDSTLSTTNSNGTSLAEVDGLPAVAYHIRIGTANYIRYRRANNLVGTSWGSITSFSVNTTLPSVSLKVVNGNPAIAFTDTSGAYFVRAIDSTGSSWPTPTDVFDFTGSLWGGSKNYISMTTVDGAPAFSCYNQAAGTLDLVYAKAADKDGVNWIPTPP